MEEIIKNIKSAISDINVDEYLEERKLIELDDLDLVLRDNSKYLLNSIIFVMIRYNKHYNEFTVDDVYLIILAFNWMNKILEKSTISLKYYNLEDDSFYIHAKDSNGIDILLESIKDIQNTNYLIWVNGEYKYKENVYFEYDGYFYTDTFAELACELYRYLKPNGDIKIALKD